MSYDYSSLENIQSLKNELQKTTELRDGIISTKSSISEDTYKKYFAEYSEKIKNIEDEITKCEKKIAEIEYDIVKRKNSIETEMKNIEKSIEELKVLHSSSAIDEKEYNKRKADNDIIISRIEKENVMLLADEREFQRILHGGIKTSKASSKQGKKLFIIAGSIIAAAIVIFLSVSFLTKFNKTEFGKSNSDYQKIYPIRIPVVDNSLRYGFADENSIIVIPPQFDSVRAFSEGMAAVRLSGKWGFIDSLGNVVIDYRFDTAPMEFSDGLAPFTTNKKWGYIDTNGNIAIEPIYESAKNFYKELAPVKIDGKWGYINTKGKIVIEPKFLDAYRFTDDNIAVVRAEDNKRGFIDMEGKYKINPTYRDVNAFSEGLAPVMVANKWGYINAENKIIVPIRYDAAGAFLDGFASAKISDKYVVIDTNDTIIRETSYSNMNNLGYGMFTSFDGKYWDLSQAIPSEEGYAIYPNIQPSSILPIEIYGNGNIFRVKTYYGYTLYDSSFTPVMNYYFRHAGIYKYYDNLQNNNQYIMILYNEGKRVYTGGVLHVDEDTYEIIFDKAKSIDTKTDKITITFESGTTSEIKIDNGLFVMSGNLYEKINDVKLFYQDIFQYAYTYLTE